MDKRICNNCKEIKDLTEFYSYWRSARKRFSYYPYCKPCVKLMHQVYLHTPQGILTRRKWIKKYAQTEQGKALAKKRCKSMRDKYPERYKARTAVNNALRLGKINKKPCKCGETKVDAHHSDYSNPLRVDWLCRTEHLRKHDLYQEVAI